MALRLRWFNLGMLLLAAAGAFGAESDAAKPQALDEARNALSKITVRGTAKNVSANNESGWPRYEITVTAVLKNKTTAEIKPGSVLTIKSTHAMPKTEATFYLGGGEVLSQQNADDPGWSHAAPPAAPAP